MTERVYLLSFKTLVPSGVSSRPNGQIIWRGKGNENYTEDLGKQQQTFTLFHGSAPAIKQPKNNTLQDENR